ncbi:bacillithiol system protein YtxJ [Pedobacter glucosidilyticus]|nr:bacillithiol system redox-active protein YtxJ [Pedobacter glucosidilyticus]KHJ37808.1 bacillithiol system protein YtxJ [Pedobacter glucosidilyticus]
MNWINLDSEEQLNDLKNKQGNSVIFKHSTRCSISMMAKKRLDMDGDIVPENLSCYYLDLLNYRSISNQIADLFQVHHESPQLLLIQNGECILDQSHGEINLEEVVEMI